MKPPNIVTVHFLSTKWSKKLFTINHYEPQNSKCIVTQELSAYDSSADGISNYIIYQNSSGDLIELNYDTQKYTSLIDNEHYSILHVKINNVEGTFFESQDNRFMNILIWDTTNNYFKLKSTLGMNEMIKIAENLK